MNKQNTDFIIIGAGPIGIEMAIALKDEAYNFRHFEAGSIASTIAWWAPETMFFSSSDRISIAGVPIQNSSQNKTTREEYLSYLRSVVQQFDLNIETYSRVTDIQCETDGYTLSISKSFHGVGGPLEYETSNHFDTNTTEKVKTKKLIFAIGDMHLPNLLNVPGESLPHVSHFLQEPHQYSSSQVLIYGGMNSAIEAAIRLFRAGTKITLAHRKSELDIKRIKPWLLPEIKKMIRTGEIAYLPGTHLENIDTDKARLISIRDKEEGSPQVYDVKTDKVLLLTGYRQNPDLYVKAQIPLEGENLKPVFNPKTMESSHKGIYFIGTGAAGTQVGGVTEYIETSHIHVKKIIAHLKGEPPPEDITLRDILSRET